MNEPMLFKPKSVYFHASHISLGFLICASSLSAFNSSVDNVSSTLSWAPHSIYIPITNALFIIGATLGCATSASISMRIGRRGLFVLFLKLFICSSFLTIIPFTPCFLLGRFFSGYFTGNIQVISPVFVNEITPDSIAGKAGSLVQIGANLGLILSYGASLLLPTSNYDTDLFNYYWMFLFILPAIVAAYQLYYFYNFYKLDSPAWYLMQNRKDDAVNSLRYIYTEEGIEFGLSRFGKLFEEKLTFKELLTDKKFRKMNRISILMNVIQQVSGVNIIVIYSTSIFKEIGGTIFVSRVLTLLIGIVLTIAGFLTVPLLTKYGRKTLLLSGQCGLILVLALLGLFSGFVDAGVYASAICIYIYFFLFSISLGSAFWAFLGESVNDLALCMGITIGLSSLVLLSFSFPLLVDAIGISQCFFIFSGLLFLSVIYECFDLFETKGKSKQEILDTILINN